VVVRIAEIVPVLVVAVVLGLVGGAPGAFAQGTPAAEKPAWQTIELTDARTGDTFTLGDFDGKTVYVEPMATWCPPCREQLGRAAAAREDLDTAEEEFVFVALSTEMGLPNEMLAAYAEENGFDFRFAVMSPDLLKALVDEFGREAAVPPGTPHFLIHPDGSATELSTGPEEADELVARMTEAAEAAEAAG
jgi:thiol-disulfide isomerase/thioredoxin